MRPARCSSPNTPAEFKAWLEGQRTLLGKLITRRQHQAGLSETLYVSRNDSSARKETAAAAMIMKAGL